MTTTLMTESKNLILIPIQGYVSSLRSARALPNDYWTAETVEDYMRCKVAEVLGRKILSSKSCSCTTMDFQVINFPIGVSNPLARRGAFKTWILSRSVEEKVGFVSPIHLSQKILWAKVEQECYVIF